MTNPDPQAAAARVATVCKHTLQPEGYLQWHSWAHEMAKTHRQHRCPVCNRWQIWVPKQAKA